MLALALCQFFAEVFVVRNYAFTVIFTTPLASRFWEMILSVIFGTLLLWLWFPKSRPRHHKWLVTRIFAAMCSLLGALLTTSPSGALAQQRDLQYELLGERRAAQSLANNFPQVAKERWNTHLAVQMSGYGLLDSAAAHPGRSMSVEEIAVLGSHVRTASKYR